MSGAQIRLPADPASVAAARRFVETTLREWGFADLVEPARLCVSELVTNVVIHAHTDVEVSLTTDDAVLRVTIDDLSPQLPLPKQYAVDAATGRGLHLVEFLARAWGAEPIGAGKRVWFELALDGTVPEAVASKPNGSGPPNASALVDDREPTLGPVLDVQIIGLPVELYWASAAHNDELQREFELIHQSDNASVPARLLAIAAELREMFGAMTQEQNALLADASANGITTVDVLYRVPAIAAEAARHFSLLLDEADDFCRHERMLTVATPPELVAFRHWFFNQFVEQIEGSPPRPWPGSPEAGPGGWSRNAEAWAQSLQAEETAVIVVDARGLVRRWSRSAAAIYGYPAGEARGRRLSELVGDPAEDEPMSEAISGIVGWRTNLVRRRMHNRDGAHVDIVGYAVRTVDGEPAVAMLGIPAGGALGPDDQPSPATWRRLQLLAAERVARLEGEEATDVLATVHEVSRALSETNDISDVGEVVTREAALATGAAVASLIVVHDEELVLAGEFGHNESWSERWRVIDRAAELPINVALRDGTTLWVSSPDEGAQRFGAEIASPAFAVLPLRSEGRMIGALNIGWNSARSFPATDRSLLDALADVSAHAMSRTIAHERTKATVTSLEASTARLQSLQSLTAGLARAMRREAIAATVLEEGVRDIGADCGSLCLLSSDGQSLELFAHIGYSEDVGEQSRSFPLSADLPASEAVRSGEPLFLSEPETGASAVLPLLAERGAAFGALTIGFDRPRSFDEADRAFLLALASQCATGLERVALSERVESALRSAERDRAFLSTLFEQAPIGLAFFDVTGRYLQVNETLAALHGIPAADFIGQQFGEVEPSIALTSQRDLHDVVATGQPVLGRELTGVDDTGKERHWLLSWYPVRDEVDKTFAVGCVVLDITDRKQAERNLERVLSVEQAARAAAESASRWLDRLQAVTDRVALGSVDAEAISDEQLDELLSGLLIAVRDLFDGDAAALLISDEHGNELTTRAAVGMRAALDIVHIPSGAGIAGRVMAAQRPFVFDDITKVSVVSPMLRDSGLRSLVAVPLMSSGRALGVMHVASNATAKFTYSDADRLALIGDRIAGALERSRLLSAERAARAAAERAHERLAFLSDASRVVASSLDRRQILDRVARLAVPRLADWCTVYVMRGDQIVRAGVHATDRDRGDLPRLRPSVEGAVVANSVVARVWQAGHAVLVDDPTREPEVDLGPGADEIIGDLGMQSVMIVPVITRGRTEAVMTFGVGTDANPYTRDDLALAQELAGRVATGLTNAALYEREHSVAESLTRAVLPESLPALPGLAVAARYRPAGPNVDVGGDWYDAFELPGHRIGLAIGDVAGHGLPAASGMVQLRNALRAYAISGAPPGEVLALTADYLAKSEHEAEVIATVLYAIYDSGTITWASAGHLPPLFVAPGHAEILATESAPLLGVGVAAAYPEQQHELAPGTGFILYTDGLIEERDASITAGFERLTTAAKLLESLQPNAACATLIDELTGKADREDDCCIVCVHRPK